MHCNAAFRDGAGRMFRWGCRLQQWGEGRAWRDRAGCQEEPEGQGTKEPEGEGTKEELMRVMDSARSNPSLRPGASARRAERPGDTLHAAPHRSPGTHGAPVAD
jgi:hypothetical protein